jgi:hypothetical protein
MKIKLIKEDYQLIAIVIVFVVLVIKFYVL